MRAALAARIAFTGSISLFASVCAHAAPAELVAPAVPAQPGVMVGTLDAAARVDQGFELIRLGRQDQAVRLFDQVIASADKRLSGDARPHFCREDGAASRSGARPDGVMVDGAVCDAHFGKGYALIDMGRGDLAEGELRQATAMAPRDAHFANEYAELFKSRRDWQRSYDLFAGAWAIVDKSTAGPDAGVAARALRGMGYNKAQLGQYDQAAALYEQSLRYDPGSKVAQVEMGMIAKRKAIGS